MVEVILYLAVAFVYVIVGLLILSAFTPRKTERYRKYLMDLYVSGRIKQLAKKDGVELDKEAKDFKYYLKFAEKYKSKDLDDRIESELMQKVEAQDLIVDSETKE